MLSLFRLNDPYRLILALVVLILLKLPILIGDAPQLLPELNWMLIGEKMSEGRTLYTEIWEDIAPLSATMYWLVDVLFGRSPLAYQLIAMIVVMLQAAIFNSSLLKNKAYKENTYLPALIYVVLMQWFFDFNTLSPPLMSLTFVLIALNNLLYHVDQRPDDRTVLTTGLYISIGGLFYLPSIFFMLVVLFSYLFFTGTRLRRQLLFFFGLLLPFLITAVYYLTQGGLSAFSTSVLYATFSMGSKSFVNLQTFIMIALIPLLFFLMALFKIFQEARLTTYQSRYQQLMLLMFFIGVFTWILASQRSPFLLVFLVPSVTFFLTRFFLMIRRRWIAELMFAIMTAGILTVNYGFYFKAFPPNEWIDTHNLFSKETPWDEQIDGKKILVLDENLSAYKNARHATPYLDWKLSKLHLEHPDYYDNLTAIYLNMKEDMPEVIVDPNGRFDSLFNYMPTLKIQYEQDSRRKEVYFLKDPVTER